MIKWYFARESELQATENGVLVAIMELTTYNTQTWVYRVYTAARHGLTLFHGHVEASLLGSDYETV